MEETTHLKNEIDRLNKIINILVDQVETLKSENTILKNRSGAKNVNDTIADFGKGMISSFDTNTKIRNGDKQSHDTISDFENGAQSSLNTIPDFDNGAKSSLNTIPDFDNGTKQTFNTNANIGSGSKQGSGNLLLIDLKPRPLNSEAAKKLGFSLRSILPPSTKTWALRGIAAELLFIHNNGSASYKELQDITMLSDPGFAKHAPKLKRRGLIYRESHKKYKLTQLSKDLIAKTFPA